MTILLSFSCCLFAAIGSFLFGYDTGIIAAALEQPDFIQRLGNGELSDNLAGGIVSAFTGGAILGTLVVSLISDRYGRRAAILVGALIACLGGALQGGANVAATMIIGRVFAGLGVGILSPTIPNFSMEVAPPHVRGLLGGLQQWMIGLGIVTAQWVGYGCSLGNGPFTWRTPLSLQTAPALLLACGVYCWPESPRYLLEKGCHEEARMSLEKLHLNRNGSNRELIELEMQEMQAAIVMETECSNSVNWKTFLSHKPLLKRVFLACAIQLFTQTSGVNVIGYYGPRIYSSLGYTTTTALLIQGIYGALALLWNTVCILVVDRVGRRKLLIPSLVGMGAALCVEAMLVSYFPPGAEGNANALRASVAMNFVFSIFFTSLGVLSWIYSAEIFPTAFRAKGTAASTFTNWAANLVFAQCSPLALSKMGPRFFYCFTAFNWTAAVLVFAYFPETQGEKTLERVNRVFGDFTLRRTASNEGDSPDPDSKDI